MSKVRTESAGLRAIAQNLGFVASDQDRGQNEPSGKFTRSVLDATHLKPSPIRPEWILEGQPEARCINLSMGTGNWASTDHWSCTKGKFQWHFLWDETVLFLEGEVRITDETGKVYLGKPGVSLFFPAGTSAIWDVPEYIRKIAFNQRPIPRYLSLPARAINKLRNITGLAPEPKGGLG